MRFNRKTLIGAAVAMALSSGAMAADPIIFDPTGTAGAAGNIAGVTTFDYQPGNALAIAANPVGGPTVGTTFSLTYMANLGTVTDGTNILFANGIGGNFFTAVAQFPEVVTSVGANGSATFTLAAGAPNFFTLYATTASGNNLTGEGFRSGTPILSGAITSVASSNFTISSVTPVLLDQFNGSGAEAGDNLGGRTTVTGSGASDITITISIAGVNANYFPDLLNGGTIALTFFNTSQVVPFQQVQPTLCMLDGDAAGTGDGCDNGGIVPNYGGPVGATGVNGGLANAATGDFHFQVDANQSFQRGQGVPEPGSLALLGMGLGAMGLLAARRRARKS